VNVNGTRGGHAVHLASSTSRCPDAAELCACVRQRTEVAGSLGGIKPWNMGHGLQAFVGVL
jgi:hypothetical protein